MSGCEESKVRKSRRSAGMSLEQLGALTGYDKGYLSKVERGAASPTRETILAICAALPGLEPNDFFPEFSRADTAHPKFKSMEAAE